MNAVGTSCAPAFGRLSRAAALGVALLGVLVLLGWAADSVPLKSVLPGLMPMMPNTALGFVLAGFSLWLLQPGESPPIPATRRRAARILACAVAMLGLIMLSEYAFGWDLRIDQLLFPDNSGRASPGRVALATALNFTLCGMALLVLDHDARRGPHPAEFLALSMLVIGILGLAGYTYGIETLYRVAPFTAFTPHSALAFVALGAAIVAARPRRGLAAVIASDSAGGVMARRLLPAAVLLPIGLGWLRLLGERAGWYGFEFGLALFAASNVVIFVFLILWQARVLARLDVERLGAVERFIKTFQSSPIGIGISSIADDRVLDANPALLAMYGCTREELIGHRPIDLGLWAEPCERERLLVEVRSRGGVKGFETKIRRRDGALVDTVVAAETIEIDATRYLLALVNDVSEVKRAQDALRAKDEQLRSMTQQLWQSAKLATMGEIAASVAHELNNPLGTLSLRLEALLAKAPAGDPQRRVFEIMEHEVERMSTLVANLLQFSRRSTPQVSTVSLPEEIGRTLELVHYHLRNCGVVVTEDYAADLPAIQADRQQLRQLFLNLITNACDAMPKGGTLAFRARRADGSIMIEVADTGVGIAAADLARVAEPFYTTKPEGKGTGLGFGICRRIVQEHHGSIDIESAGLGQGATVRIKLPGKNGTNGAFLGRRGSSA